MVTSEESHPEESPSDDGKESEERTETFGRGQLSLFDPATGFENFMVDLDFPTVAIPLDAFGGMGKGTDGNGGEQQPAKGFHIRRGDSSCAKTAYSGQSFKRPRKYSGVRRVMLSNRTLTIASRLDWPLRSGT